MYEAVAYILLHQLKSLSFVTVTRHVCTRIFQIEHFFSCEICSGISEKYEVSCDTKASKSLKENLKKLKK